MKISSWWFKAALALALTVPAWLPRPAAAGTKAQIQLEQAKAAYDDQDYQQAMTRLNETLAEEPNNGIALHYAGLTAMKLGKAEDAVSFFEKAGQAMPGNAGVFEDLAWANLSLQRFDAALAAADKALAIDANSQRGNLFKGQALIGLKRNEEALAPLAKVQSSAYAQTAQFYAGSALIGLGRTNDAVPYFKKAQELGPNAEIGKKAGEYVAALGGGSGAAKSKDYNARVRLMYQYDTNIVTVNDDNYIPAYLETDNMEDGRAVLDADLAWHFINNKSGRASLRYIGYSSWHSEVTEMNLQYHMGELAGFFAVPAGSANLKFGAAADYAYAGLDNERYSTFWSTTPYMEVAWTKSLITGIDVTYMQEDFDHALEIMGGSDLINQRDNNRIHVTLRQHFLFAEGKLGLLAGYRWGNVWAEGRDYNRVDNGGFLGLQVALPAKSKLSAMVRYDDRLYPDNVFDRHDRLTVANVSYEIPVWKVLSVYTSVVYTNVDSNLELLEYERWIYGAGLVVDL